MHSVEEIGQAIERLTRGEKARLLQWLAQDF
jgi:hypothetical protein